MCAVQIDGHDEACLARLTAELLVPFVIDDQGWKGLFLDLSQFALVSAVVSVPWTSQPNGGHGPALAASQEFRTLLLDAVRPTAKKFLRVSVPIEKIIQMQASLVVQSLPFVPQIRLQAVAVLDGSIAAGFDVFTGPTRETQGDISTLQQPWVQWATRVAVASGTPRNEQDVQAIVAIQPAVLLKWGGMNITFQVKKLQLPDDRRIDEVTLGLASGVATLFIKATAIHDDPFPDDHIHIRLSILPMGTFIAVKATDVVFHSAGIGGLLDLFGGLVTDYVRSVVGDHLASAGLSLNWALSGAKFKGPLPGAEGSPGHALASVSPAPTAIDPTFVLSGVNAAISRQHGTNSGFDDPADDPDVIPSSANLASSPPPPFKIGLRFGPEDPAAFWPIRARRLAFAHGDHPTLRRDPGLRTVWSVAVERQDETTTTFTQDRWSDDADAGTLAIDLWSDDYYHSRRLDVRCAHYRPFENRDAALARVEKTRVYIQDRFRRDFPFVRWHRDITWSETVNGESVPKSKLRESVVHKTDIRERCQFCDVGGKTKAYNSADQTQHMMTIPAPAQAGFRVKLCPFCFAAA